MADWIKPGTHITAMGADAKGKQELDPQLLRKADMVVVDSKKQCIDHGEVAQAVKTGVISAACLVEIGHLIKKQKYRQRQHDITITDLTGLAVQDIQIAKLIESKNK